MAAGRSASRSAGAARSAPPVPAPLVAVVALALAASIGALVWLVGPGRAPAHPYEATSEQASANATSGEPQSVSYQQGPDPFASPASVAGGTPSAAGSGTATAAPATPATTAGPDAGEQAADQAALAAATLAGSDAAQITQDGLALTGSDPIADPAPSANSASAATPTPVAPSRATAPSVAPAPRLGAVPWASPAQTDALDGGAGGSVTALRADAHVRMLAFGYPEDQWPCLDTLIQHESGWSVTAANAAGAYGLPQAKPGTRMAAVGADWRTNPHTQLAWMFAYVAQRYGDPCRAWAHAQAHDWY